MNIGEEIVSAYLEYIKHCEFIQKNLYTPDVQGEIDVVGINLKDKEVYICEVAVHLITGLQYVKDRQPNNVNKIYEKFSRDIQYANKYFDGYKKHFMLWTPIVKNQNENAKHNQLADCLKIRNMLQDAYGIDLELIINEEFQLCLNELREYAKSETKEIKSPVLRLMQVEEYLERHLSKLSK